MVPLGIEILTSGFRLLESVYQFCMEVELTKRGIPYLRQHELPIVYDGQVAPDPLKMDFYFPQQLVVDLKAVTDMHPIFKAQLLTYMKLSETHVGLLINFNEILLKDGITRMVL